MTHSPLLETQRRLSGGSLELAPILGGTWELPARYGRHVRDEYDAAGRAGVIDRAWRGVLRLTGRDRQTWLQGQVSNDVLALQPGQACRAALLDPTAHVLADLTVYALPDCLLLATDPRCLDRLVQTLDRHLIMEKVTVADVSSEWLCLTLLGSELPSAAAREGAFPISGLPGEADLWLPRAEGPTAWEELTHAGVVPVGEAAWEMSRVEAGIAVWGHELDESVLLPEADLTDMVSYTKGCYVGQEIVARLHARGHANRALRRILLEDTAPVPKPGATLHVPETGDPPGHNIGRITSAVASPLYDDRALALGYVRREHWDEGTPVTVQMVQPNGAVFSFGGVVLGQIAP